MNDLPITVPLDLYEDMAKDMGKAFADSYLCGALVRSNILRPRTGTARERLAQSSGAMSVLKIHELTLGASIPPDERAPIDSLANWREAHPNHNWHKRGAPR